jgi:ATP-dependent DNA helicase RecG
MGGRVPGIKRVDYPEYPEVAFREAIVNAVIHRDWSISGEFIRVFMFDDRIEVMSPGRLLPPITVEAMHKGEVESRLRNPAIVEVFDRLGGYIEKLGTGVRRMIDAMKGHGMELPQFELKGDLLKVTLRGPGEHFMELVKKVEEIESTPGLSERQRQAIRYLQETQRMTTKEYSKLTGVSNRTALRDLRDLVDRGILQEFGKRRGKYYALLKED